MRKLFYMLIEPHAKLLKKPHGNKLLYKIIPSEFFIDMVKNNYLYFSRVDTYKDDGKDSDLPNKDRRLSDQSKFQNNPEFSAADYYDRCRKQTYACCFTTENTNYIWQHYDKNDPNAVCLVFRSGKLIQYLNSHFEESILNIGNASYVNYGLVTYINYDEQYLSERLLNPTAYVYAKDADKFSEEKEFRISLSSLGCFNYVLPNGEEFCFPPYFELPFNYKIASTMNAIKRIELSRNHTKNFYIALNQFLIEKKLEMIHIKRI